MTAVTEFWVIPWVGQVGVPLQHSPILKLPGESLRTLQNLLTSGSEETCLKVKA